MKLYQRFYLLFSVLLILTSCSNYSSSEEKESNFIQSYELEGANMKDTVNMVDAHGWKQGKWTPNLTNKLKDTVYYRNDTIIQ
jgi:hypothetical protein